MVTVKRIAKKKSINSEWDLLWKKNSTLSIYQSNDYSNVLEKHLFIYRLILRITPKYYIFKENGKTIMILPLYKKWLKNEYTLYGYKTGFGYLDAIYDENFEDSKFDECFALLKEKFGINSIEIKYVKKTTKFGEWINKYNDTVLTDCIKIDLPDKYEIMYSGFSKHTKQNIRTAYNRISTDGHEIEFNVYDYRLLTNKEKNNLIHLYIERQLTKYNRNGGILYKWFVKHVDLGTAILNCDTICVKAFVIKIDKKVAAYFDAIFSDKEIVIPRLAIDEKYKRYSPGVVLLNESIKYLINIGITKMDLTHGTEEYKLSMGGKVEECVECNLFL